MNGMEMLLRSLGVHTEGSNAGVHTATPNLTNTNRVHITKRNSIGEMDFSQSESFETKIKSEVWRKLVDHIECENYNQVELAQKLHVYQPDVSDLLRGKFSKFSTDKLIRYATRLNLHVQFQISAARITSKDKELEHA